MADFRQLALDFVLEDDDAKLADIARKAASEIETAPPGTNPVARWVEAVQPWMPASGGDDAMLDVRETPDWTSRAKALEFLSQTLAVLSQDVLKPIQVLLLVAFFGAMFDVDHKAGIMASATALSRIITMRYFPPSSGRDVIQKICALDDDFARQTAKTRLAVYHLLRSLLTDAAVAGVLRKLEGPSPPFMRRLLRLCQNERDPECLMVWFDILRFFAAEYSPSQDVLDDVFGAFKAYFPITLPRTSQSGLAPEQLKIQLRRCFSSDGRLAPLALPFLLAKLDQGDGVTVNVKLDVIRTLRACIDNYAHPEQSVAPYVDRTWTSLKYEVRNGEIEDTIWATLEVLKAVATRLKGDQLRDFTLTVTRECVGDLSSQMHCTAAGRLLISVLSANVCAFVLMVSPALTHIKDNLRYPKSPSHTQDLLKILRVILETRLLLAKGQIADPERHDFAATDPVFQILYADVYRGALQKAGQLDASLDDIKVATEAAQGAGALACQRAVRYTETGASQPQASPDLLLPEGAYAEVCDALFSVAARAWREQARQQGSDELVNEAIKALQRTVEACPSGFRPLVGRGVAIIRERYAQATPESISTIQRVSSVLAFIGCSSLRPSPEDGMRCFLGLSCALASELLAAMDDKTDARVWCALAAGLLSTVHYFKDACRDAGVQEAREPPSEQHQSASQSQWAHSILEKYPVLSCMTATTGVAATCFDHDSIVPAFGSVSQVWSDFLFIGLFLCRQLYRRATKPVNDSQNGTRALGLSNNFSGTDQDAEFRYLGLISDLASFVMGEMNRTRFPLQFELFFLGLFCDDLIALPSAAATEVSENSKPQGSWSWLALGPLNVLSFGILKSLLPSSVTRLFALGVAQQMLMDGTSLPAGQDDVVRLPVMRAMLAVLANKYPVEKLDESMAAIERHLEVALQQATKGNTSEDRRRSLEQATTIFTLAGGLLRRCTGTQTRGLVRLMFQAPDDPSAGLVLGRGLQIIVAPQPFVADSIGSVQRPLWIQKAYVDLVKPMVGAASGASPESHGPLVKYNYGVAVLLMVKHMKFPVYEQESSAILRIAISVAQNPSSGPDAKASLEVVKNILVEAPEAIRDHLGSLVNICTGLFSRGPVPAPRRPQRLPQGCAAAPGDADARAGCDRLALEIVGGLPRVFEARHLLPLAPRVQRELAGACGLASRDLRKIARLARAAWSDLK